MCSRCRLRTGASRGALHRPSPSRCWLLSGAPSRPGKGGGGGWPRRGQRSCGHKGVDSWSSAMCKRLPHRTALRHTLTHWVQKHHTLTHWVQTVATGEPAPSPGLCSATLTAAPGITPGRLSCQGTRCRTPRHSPTAVCCSTCAAMTCPNTTTEIPTRRCGGWHDLTTSARPGHPPGVTCGGWSPAEVSGFGGEHAGISVTEISICAFVIHPKSNRATSRKHSLIPLGRCSTHPHTKSCTSAATALATWQCYPPSACRQRDTPG